MEKEQLKREFEKIVLRVWEDEFIREWLGSGERILEFASLIFIKKWLGYEDDMEIWSNVIRLKNSKGQEK